MLQILHRQLPARLNQAEAQRLQHGLQAQFPSLLAGVRLEYLRRLSLEDEPARVFGMQDQSRLLGGEVFPLEPGTVAYVKVTREQGDVEAGVISNQTHVEATRFFQTVQQVVAETTGRHVEWQHPGETTGGEPEDSRSVSLEVSEKELEAAGEFLNPASKDLLNQLRQIDSVPLSKLRVAGSNVQSVVQHLEDLDLVRRDYAVLSKETGQQILKVASRESLETSTYFSSENVDEVLSCTPFCRSLMDNDQWLLILVLGQLRQLGFSSEQARIQVVQGESVPTQVFVRIYQQRFLLVLTHTKLTIDESYLISAQIAACQLEDVVLVSTQRIANLMRSHLKSTNPNISFHFIDGIANLPERLNEVFTEKQRHGLKDVLESLSDLTPVKLQELIVRKMVPIPVDDSGDGPLQYLTPSLSESMPEFTPPLQQDYEMPEPAFPPASSASSMISEPTAAPEAPRPLEFNTDAPHFPQGASVSLPETRLNDDDDRPGFEEERPSFSIADEQERPAFGMADRMPPVPLPVDDFPGGFGRASSLGGASRAPRAPGELPLD